MTVKSELAAIAAFEVRYGYDASYMKEMLERAPAAYEAFKAFVPMASHRQAAPADVYFAARIAAFQAVDCGPCLQLAVRKAREAGVSESVILGLFEKEGGSLNPLIAEAKSFAVALLEGSAAVESLRLSLTRQMGPEAVVELALAVASAQVFPVVKRAMGHFRSCGLTPLDLRWPKSAGV